jgi:AbrB family looped-hinge helix DNA binding protein
MKKNSIDLKFIKTSTKGQIVIPLKIREKLDIHNGSILAVTTEKDMIVLKKVESGLTSEDLKTLKLVEGGWKDMEIGRHKTRSKEDFFKELKEW